MNNLEAGLTVNKIYIDSRFRTATSRSDSDFSVELPETVYLPVGTRCYVSDVSITHSWYTIEDNISNKLYFSYKHGADTYSTIITITSQNYSLDTLVDELQARFKDIIEASPMWVQDRFNPSVVANEAKGTLSIINLTTDVGGNFLKWSDVDITDDYFAKTWQGGSYNSIFPSSINRVLKNFKTQTNNNANPFQSGFVDLITNHSIYIKSPQLGTFQNIGPRGERDILKKVLVNVPFGDLITQDWYMDNDFTDCSRLALKTLYFRITDVDDSPLQLHGHHVSFSLIFATKLFSNKNIYVNTW